jgi:hypothetical protein
MIQIIECEQGTDEWLTARLGIPTASCFKTVLAKGEGKTRAEYMRKLAGEVLTQRPMDSYSNGHMERGKEWEPDARNLYAFMQDVEPQVIGFIRNGQKGCSPDSLVGTDGGLEIKAAAAHIQVDRLLSNRLPHKSRGAFGLPSASGGISSPTAPACPCLSFVSIATRNISPLSRRPSISSTKSFPRWSSVSAP